MFTRTGQPSLLPCSAVCGGRAREGTMQLTCLALASFSNELSYGTGSFSHCSNPCCSPQSALSISILFSKPHPHSPPPCQGFSLSSYLTGLVVLFVSLIPWLSEFHAVWFSGTSGCLLILDWLLFSFWLCEEVKGFYLHLHLGRNSDFRFDWDKTRV